MSTDLPSRYASARMKAWTFESIAPSAASVDAVAGVEGPEGKWKTGIFGCFSNFGMCCWVAWCQPCTIVQILGFSESCYPKDKAKCASATAVVAFVFLTLLATVLVLIANPLAQSAGYCFAFMVYLLAAGIVCHVRDSIRLDQDIKADDMEDCSFSLFCLPCSVCQIFSQKNVKACTSDTNAVQYKSPFTFMYDGKDAKENASKGDDDGEFKCTDLCC